MYLLRSYEEPTDEEEFKILQEILREKYESQVKNFDNIGSKLDFEKQQINRLKEIIKQFENNDNVDNFKANISEQVGGSDSNICFPYDNVLTNRLETFKMCLDNGKNAEDCDRKLVKIVILVIQIL